VDVRGTLMTDPSEDSVEAPPKPTSGTMMFPPTPERTVSRSGTIMFDADDHDNPTQPPTERKQVVLSQDEQHEEEQRLRYLCRLIIKHRQPLAPINGVLTLLPFSIVQTGRREGSELQRVIRNDVRTLVDTLRLRCPVISLVVGMEEESGFREMVRRMGRDAAREQRIGKGYSVGNPSTPEQLEALSAHACAWFEGQIYRLFGERGALAKPGNTKLYALLCKIRRMVRTPLTNILVNGYAEDASEKRGVAQEPLFFSGCYFAAAGEVEERRAFVKSVFEKLPAEQEELQWTEAALAEDDRYRRLSHLVTWVDALLLISVIGLGVAWVRMLMGRG